MAATTARRAGGAGNQRTSAKARNRAGDAFPEFRVKWGAEFQTGGRHPLPSSVELLLDEFRGDLYSRFVFDRFTDKGFLRDLQDQSMHAIQHHSWPDMPQHRDDRPAAAFDIVAAGGLSAFSHYGKCPVPMCRVAAAWRFAQTAALFAERVYVPDAVTWRGAVDPWGPAEAFSQIAVLKTIEPLLRTGVVQFCTPIYTQCKSCGDAGRKAAKRIASRLASEFNRTATAHAFTHERKLGLFVGSPLFRAADDSEEVGHLFAASRRTIPTARPGEPMSRRETMRHVQRHRRYFANYFDEYANDLIYDTRIAAMTESAVATGLNIGAAALRYLDGRQFHAGDAAEAAVLRGLPLPDFNRLSPPQVLAVRDRAHKALPAFRARLQGELFSLRDTSESGEESRARRVAKALTAEAHDLRGQLESVNLPGGRRREKLYTALSFALQIVALGTRNPEIVLGTSGTFMHLLSEAHKSRVQREQQHEQLVHQPAYVLLAARQAHAKH